MMPGHCDVVQENVAFRVTSDSGISGTKKIGHPGSRATFHNQRKSTEAFYMCRFVAGQRMFAPIRDWDIEHGGVSFDLYLRLRLGSTVIRHGQR